MNQTFTAILLKAKPYGESSFVLTLFSEELGKVRGLVKGGKKIKANLQPMSIFQVEWKRRLNSQLGTMRLEPLANPTPLVFHNFLHLQGLGYVAEMLDVGMAEEEAHPNLYQHTQAFLCGFNQPQNFWKEVAFFELQVLASLGYGLSLNRAEAVLAEGNPQGGAGGDQTPLCWVSPKSGRAVSWQMGEPYAKQLMRLPTLFGGEAAPGQKPAQKEQDFVDVFTLTGHFLEQALHGQAVRSRTQLLKLGDESGFVE